MVYMSMVPFFSENDPHIGRLLPVKCTSYEVFTSYEVHGGIDTSDLLQFFYCGIISEIPV